MLIRTLFLVVCLGVASTAFANSGGTEESSPTPLAYPALLVPSFGVGLTGGLNSPYGSGVELSYLIVRRWDVNVGAGIGLAGLRAGVGSRIYLKPKGFSPYVGAYVSRNLGESTIDISVNGVDATYQINNVSTFIPQVGLKLGLGKAVALMGGIGYGFSFSSTELALVNGQDSADHRQMAELFTPGGLSLNGTAIIRF